jgi:hypothetical protein
MTATMTTANFLLNMAERLRKIALKMSPPEVEISTCPAAESQPEPVIDDSQKPESTYSHRFFCECRWCKEYPTVRE